MNTESIENIYEETCNLICITEKITDLIQAIAHEKLQNTIKEMTVKLQTVLFDMNSLCYELLYGNVDDMCQ